MNIDILLIKCQAHKIKSAPHLKTINSLVAVNVAVQGYKDLTLEDTDIFMQAGFPESEWRYAAKDVELNGH